MRPGGYLIDRAVGGDGQQRRDPWGHQEGATDILHRVPIDSHLRDDTADVGDIEVGRIVESDIPVGVGLGERNGPTTRHEQDHESERCRVPVSSHGPARTHANLMPGQLFQQIG